MCKYMVQFLLHNNLHVDNMVLYLSEDVKEKVESVLALQESNLFEMYEKLEEVLEEIINSENLIPHPVWDSIVKGGKYDAET